MPNKIDLLASHGLTLDATMQRALDTLHAGRIQTAGAAQLYFGGERTPVARILLLRSTEKPRALEVLAGFEISDSTFI